MLILLILLQDVKIEEYGLTRSSLPIKEKEGGEPWRAANRSPWQPRCQAPYCCQT